MFPILPGINCGVLKLYAAQLLGGLHLDSVSVISFPSLCSSTLIFHSTFFSLAGIKRIFAFFHCYLRTKWLK